MYVYIYTANHLVLFLTIVASASQNESMYH